MLQRACQACYFDMPQAMTLLLTFELDRMREAALVTLFNKLTQPDTLHSLLAVMPESSRLSLHKRLGSLWLTNQDQPSGKFWLDLAKMNDTELLRRLLEYQTAAPHQSYFRDVRFAATPTHVPVQYQVPQALVSPPVLQRCAFHQAFHIAAWYRVLNAA